MTILNTAQSLEIRGLTDTVSGPKQKGMGPMGISPMKELRPTKRGPTPNNNQLDSNGERKRTKMDVVNEAQNLLDKEMAANNQNPPVTAESGMMEVKQEFGAITIERGSTKTPNTPQTGSGTGSAYETQSVQFPGDKDSSAVANMGYDGYDENETEYIPEAGIVLQDDDRVSNRSRCSCYFSDRSPSSFFSFFHHCPAFTTNNVLTAPNFTFEPNSNQLVAFGGTKSLSQKIGDA